MKIFYIIVLLAVFVWKGYYAGKRGINTWRKDCMQHDSLREYLLGNGATEWQSLWPFYRHALQRSLLPLLSMWRLWLVLLAFGLLIWWLA